MCVCSGGSIVHLQREAVQLCEYFLKSEIHGSLGNNSILFISSSIFSLHRCEGTGLMSLLPSMPPAKNHRATMSTAGWILILALFVAQQVEFAFAKSLFLTERECWSSLFQAHPSFQTRQYGYQVNHLLLGNES